MKAPQEKALINICNTQPIMGEESPVQNESSHLPESHDDRAFDTMLRLLIMMEGELQTKEAIIEVLMEGRSKDQGLFIKLNKLLGVRETDPFSALRRDCVYSHQKWSELFVNDHERGHAVLADSSRYLSACSSLRAISVARLQNQRYCEAYEMLQRTVRSYKKLKIKYTKERRKTLNEASSSTTVLQHETNSAVKEPERLGTWEQVEQERERCRELEHKVEELTKTLEIQHRHTMSIEKQMRDEIRRLNRELRQEREDAKRKNHCRLVISTRNTEPLLGKHG